MPKIQRQTGTTSQILLVNVLDTASTTGAGKTGILFNASGLAAYYKRNTASASTAITLQTITTLGSFATGGWKEVDATNMPGIYEFHIPNTALTSGADSVAVYIGGASGMAPVRIEIELTATSNQDGVRYGMTALPNAAAAATGGVPTVDSTNSVKVQSPLKKNTALTGFMFQMYNSSGVPTTALTVSGQVSLDGAAFGATTNSPAEVSNGWYKINLAAADMNATVVSLRFSATGALDTDLTFLTQA